MDENQVIETEKTGLTAEIEFNSSETKKEHPLSVRIDQYFKEQFEALAKISGVSKKMLLEKMILNYLEREDQVNREEQISFSHEINLIATNLEEIMNVFKKIATKSQDTVGSLRECYAQQAENSKLQIKILQEQIQGYEEKNTLMEAAQKGFILEKEKYEKNLKDLAQTVANHERDYQNLQQKNTALLEELNILRQLEKENLILHNELTKSTKEIQEGEERLAKLNYQNDKLQQKFSELEEKMLEAKAKKAVEIETITSRIRQETDLNQKAALIQAHTEYNQLQMENLQHLRNINELMNEIRELKIKIAELTDKTNPPSIKEEGE